MKEDISSNTIDKQDSEFTQTRVPQNYYHKFSQLFFIMLGFTFFSPSMITGGRLGLGLNMRDFILAVVIGNLCLSIYTGLLAYISQKSGLNLDLLANQAFGSKGSYLSSLAVSITQTGWFGVGVAMFAIPISKLYNINTYILVILVGLLMTITAILGIKALSIFGTIAVPLIALLGLYSSYIGVKEVGSIKNVFSDAPTQPILLTTAFGLVIANFISGGTSTPNFTRFAKNSKQAISTTVIAFLFGNILMLTFGAIGASVYNKADIFDVLIIQGLKIPAIFTLGLNIWSTNNNALYTAGLSVANLSKISIKLATFIMGAIGSIGAIYLYDNFVSYLTTLGSVIPPIGAVIIVHYFLHTNEVNNGPEIPNKKIHWPAIISIMIGVSLSFVISIGIKAINSLVLTIVVYLILEFLNNKFIAKKDVKEG